MSASILEGTVAGMFYIPGLKKECNHVYGNCISCEPKRVGARPKFFQPVLVSSPYYTYSDEKLDFITRNFSKIVFVISQELLSYIPEIEICNIQVWLKTLPFLL